MSAPLDLLLIVGGLSVVTFFVFGGMLGGIRKAGGKVRADTFALPELLISLVLGGFFVALIIKGALRADEATERPVSLDQVLPNAFFFVIMFAGIGAFLKHRGINLSDAFGLGRVSILRAVGTGAALIILTFPLVLCGSLITQLALGQSAEEQELVSLFKEVAHDANHAGIAKILIAGAIIAPICEEFLFRGLFYTVFKRYLGAVPSALLTSALFAATHLTLTALPSLFLLALCFVIAYEATGSLLVPVTMHALFNGAQLAFLYYVTTHGIPS